MTTPIFLGNWCKRSHDRGLNFQQRNATWRDDPFTHCVDEFHRVDSQGELCQRYIAEIARRTRYNNGTPDGGMNVSFGRWHAIPSERREAIIAAVIERRREDALAGRPSMGFGLYCGSRHNGSPYTNECHGSDGPLDLNLPDEKHRWEESIGPWMDALGEFGFEVWYDAGGVPAVFGAIIKLINQQKSLYGIGGGTEAIAHTRDQDSSTPWPDDIQWGRYVVPMLCSSRFILDRDPDGTLDWDDDEEVHIINNNTARVNGEAGTLTELQAMEFSSRGWTVGSWQGDHDGVVNL